MAKILIAYLYTNSFLFANLGQHIKYLYVDYLILYVINLQNFI